MKPKIRTNESQGRWRCEKCLKRFGDYWEFQEHREECHE